MMLFRLTFLLAGVFSLMIPAQILALDNCGSSKKNNSIESNMINGGLQIISTQTLKVDSDLKEDFIKSLYKAESAARIQLLKWMKSNCENKDCFIPVKLIDTTNLSGFGKMFYNFTNSLKIPRKFVIKN